MLTDQELPTVASVVSSSGNLPMTVFNSITSSGINIFNQKTYTVADSEDFITSHGYFYETFSGKKSLKIPSGIIPPGLLYASEEMLIFERPPSIQTITWTPSMLDDINEESSYNTYQIPVPWQVYFVSFSKAEQYHIINNIRLAFCSSPLNSFDQPLYLPPITNFYTTSEMCQPSYSLYEDLIDGTDTIAGIMQKAYTQVWSSGMNVDLTASVLKHLKHFAFDSLQIIGASCRLRPSTIHYKNTVARHCSNLPSAIEPTSYYTNSSLVHSFYQSWEKIPLSEICSMEWAPIDTTVNDNSFYDSVNSIIRSSTFYQHMLQNKHVKTSRYSEDYCCEDCQYYDDDGEPVAGECVEEGQCYCHENREEVIYSTYDDQGNNLLVDYIINHSTLTPQQTFTLDNFCETFYVSTKRESYNSFPFLSYLNQSLNSSNTFEEDPF